MSGRNSNFNVGFTSSHNFLPKQGVQLGINKSDNLTSNQMFYQWIQPKPTNLR